MATRNKKHLDHKKIKNLRNSGLGHGTFHCEPCDYYGYDTHGALRKHNKSNGCIANHQRIVDNRPILPQLDAPMQPAGLDASATITPMSLANQPGHLTATFRRPFVYIEDEMNASFDTDGPEGPEAVVTMNTDSAETGVIFIEQDPAPGAAMDPYSVYILRHPHATRDLAFKPLHHLKPVPLYWPFKTEMDYLQSSLFVKTNATDPAITGQLSLDHRMQQGLVTLKNAKDFHQTLANAVIFPEDKFVTHTVTTTFDGKDYQHTFWHRNLLEAIREVVADPDFKDVFAFNAEKVYRKRPDGDGVMRVYQQYHQSNDMWSIQTSMGPNTVPIIISIYSDATQLSSYGTNHLWPIYFWVMNLPYETRSCLGKGGAKLVGYLPDGDHKGTLKKSQFGDFNAKVFHDCLRVLLSSVEDAARYGDVFRFGDGLFRHSTIIVPVRPADYPEICKHDLLIGQAAKDLESGCPCCHVPNDCLHDNTTKFPLRDSKLQTKAVEVHLGLVPNVDLTVPTPRELGIRPVVNAWDPVTNVHHSNSRASAGDNLHVNDSGKGGRGHIPEVTGRMRERQAEEMDVLFADLPPYPDLIHFAQGISKLKWRSGRDNYTIARMWVPILEAVLPDSRATIDPKYFPYNVQLRENLLLLLRALGEWMLLCHFDTHTDFTLEIASKVLERLSKLEKVVAEVLEMNLNTFKNHYIYHHFLDSIRDKGPVCNTDTGFGEAHHRASKNDYRKSNMRPGEYESQLLRKVLERQVITDIESRVAEDRERIDFKDPLMDSIGNVKLGAKEKRRPLWQIMEEFPLHQGFPNLEREKLKLSFRRFLYAWVPSFHLHGERPRADQLPEVEQLMASRCYTAQIFYISLLDSSTLTGRIRFNPRWGTDENSRYDYVLFNMDDNSFGYGQVMNVFSIVVEGITYAMALLLDLKPKKSRCKSTRFIHASANPLEASGYRFVMVNSIIRPAFVHPPHPRIGHPTRYIINDLIDYDMYLRLLNVT